MKYKWSCAISAVTKVSAFHLVHIGFKRLSHIWSSGTPSCPPPDVIRSSSRPDVTISSSASNIMFYYSHGTVIQLSFATYFLGFFLSTFSPFLMWKLTTDSSRWSPKNNKGNVAPASPTPPHHHRQLFFPLSLCNMSHLSLRCAFNLSLQYGFIPLFVFFSWFANPAFLIPFFSS